MGGVYGKKKLYSIDHEPPGGPGVTNEICAKSKEHRPVLVNMEVSPHPTSTCPGRDEDDDLIKPRKPPNPVRESKSHQQVQRELLHRSVEMKPELQRVLESRKRDQLMKQRKEEKEAHRKLSPLEAELMRRHRRLEELDEQLQKEQQEEMRAPEFIKVKENLRRTSLPNDEKEV